MLLAKSVVHDARVRREASALQSAGHDVTVMELAEVREDERSLDGFERRSALPPAAFRALPGRSYRAAFAAALVSAAARERPDVIHAHDALMLLPGLFAARLAGARLVYDSHELATGVPYRGAHWAALVRVLERTALPRAAAVITVSEGIADVLADRYALRARPVVVRNVPAHRPPREHGPTLRAALGLAEEVPLVVHEGAVVHGRGGDVAVRAVAKLPGVHLAFLGDVHVERELRALASELGIADRVHVVASVAVEDLLAWTRDADAGLSLLQNTCENHRLALPNKVFDYIAAGVTPVVSDLPELRRLVAGRRLGFVVTPDDPSDVAAGIARALAARPDSGLRERLRQAGRDLTWQRESGVLTGLYARLAAD